MIAFARMAFPGFLMGLMLAGPALAAPSPHAATGPQSARHVAAQARAKPARLRQARARLRAPEAHGVAGRHGRAAALQSAVAFADLAYDDPRAAAPHGAGAADDSAPRAAAASDDHQTGWHQTGWHQTGMASWYGGQRWQGHRTSSGDRYDESVLTAAHASLPLGSRIRVTAEGTGRSVVVLINDRPGSRTRIIDLSRSAAVELGIADRGVARVTLSEL